MHHSKMQEPTEISTAPAFISYIPMDVWSVIQMLYTLMQHCYMGYWSLAATIRINIKYTSIFSIQMGVLLHANYATEKRKN